MCAAVSSLLVHHNRRECVYMYVHINMYINHSGVSLDIHLDLGFSIKLKTLSEVFPCLKSNFFQISALYEVGY